MTREQIKELLHGHELRATPVRFEVLKVISSREEAFSNRDLEDQLPDFDRVTLYRTLQSFIDKSLIHKIPGDSGSASYALSIKSDKQNYQSSHIHFQCIICGKLECLPDFAIPIPNLPTNYKMTEISMVVKGKCDQCNE
ncbi:Fur family transcriptional regulator [Marinigracilibium pacificum]|uniref:Transcriptional repressor n=1 Tax=Marinigracilibium pacificum TaxID=2729599 RepID=A0A848J646_9BACT|nr:transcriptional repressor [Marinigracilibium pacificum]NMM49849.1 transcriptional repressor [Marinigracilibium pacificum]